MPHRKNKRTGQPLSHDPKIREQQLIEEKKFTGGAPGLPEPTPNKTDRGVLRSEETGRPSGIEIRDRTFLGLSPEDVQRVAAGEQGRAAGVAGAGDIGTQARQEQTRQQLGTQPLIEELQQKIDEPPEIQGTITEESERIRAGQREFFGRVFSGEASSEEIIKEAKNFGTGVAITGAAVSSIIVIPVAAGIVMSSKVASLVSGLALATGGILAGGKLTDIDRGNIATARNIIQGMVEEGERIEADVRNGLDPSLAVDRLSQMADEIVNAESEIKKASIFNLKYRIDDESTRDQQAIIKAREAIRRRLRAVENIAATGTAALNPEALLMGISQR